MASILELPEETIVRHRYTLGTAGVQVSRLGLSKEKAEEFAGILKDYVSSRFGGHSSEYAVASLKQRLLEPTVEEDGFRANLFEAYPNLPRGWVKADPFSGATATNSVVGRKFVVVDGEIAWSYYVPPAQGRASMVRVDAREFDVKTRPKFDAARQEAEPNLRKRPIKKGFGYVHHFEREFDSVLVSKHGIRRRSFRELNPGIILD